MKVGVLVSGTGSNLGALIAASERGDLAPATIAVVISNRPGVQALERARNAGIPHTVIDHKGYDDRASFERALIDELTRHRVDAVVLAGFMRILTDTFVSSFPQRILNTHPALCPAFPGVHAARQAIEHGAKITGCTVHLVDSGVDTGPIVFQAAVEIKDDDDPASLQSRIQQHEHRLLPKAVQALAAGHLQIRGRRVSYVPSPAE